MMRPPAESFSSPVSMRVTASSGYLQRRRDPLAHRMALLVQLEQRKADGQFIGGALVHAVFL